MWSRVKATGRAQAAVGDGVVDGEGQAGPLAVAQPGDPGGQALADHVLGGEADPVRDPVGAVEQLEAERVDGGEVRVLAREADPAKRPDSLAEQRPDVARGEDVDGERLGQAAGGGVGADVVAVVEHHGAALAQREHAPDVADHRGQRQRLELARVAAAQRRHLLQAHAGGQVAGARIVGGGEVGDDVGDDIARQQALQQIGGVADQRHRAGLAGGTGAQRGVQGLVEVLGDEVDDPRVAAAADLLGVGVGDQADALEHAGDRHRLGGAHAAEAAADHQPPAQARRRSARAPPGRRSRRCPGARPGSRCTASSPR